MPVKSVTIQTAEKVKTPAANQESGSLLPAGSEIIFTSLTEDAVIRYTTDNSEPDESSNEYREPIVLQNNTVIKAAAFKEGMEQSETAVFTFLTEARALDIEETSRIAIDYIQERITGFISDEKYTINGTPYVPADTNRAIDDTWFGTALTIMKNGKEGVTIDSELQNLSIPQRPEAPDSLGVEGNRIIGVTAAMEYRNIEEDEWTACAGTQITGLSAGMYDIRFKAVAGVSFASQIETIRLREVLTPPPPIKNTNSPSPKETASPAVTKEPVLTAAPEETPTLSSPNRILKITPPKKPSSVKVKNKKGKKLLVSWKKVPQANGYQAVIAQNKKFTKAKKTKNTATVKWTFKKLKKKKTYYVRVRAYRKSGKQKIYGKWSARKKIKIRK